MFTNFFPNFDAKCFSAIAIPTEFAKPCPKGPVVVSMPDSISYSGWPGVLLFNCLNCLI